MSKGIYYKHKLLISHIMNIPIYVVNMNDPIRKNKMIKRFDTIGLKYKFTPPVYSTDSRLSVENEKINKRAWSCQLAHLDSIKDFYENTDNEYCIVCEDDILISKNFNRDLPLIIDNFNKLNLDILLLGYLLPFKLQFKIEHANFKFKNMIGYSFNEYPDNLWGSQMYLLKRSYAKFLLDKYTIEFALNDLDKPYAADWTITKNGNRAMLYPMLAVEEGDTNTTHLGQKQFHKNCFLINYDANIYI